MMLTATASMMVMTLVGTVYSLMAYCDDSSDHKHYVRW